MDMAINIVIVEDDNELREALSAAIESCPEFTFKGAYADAESFSRAFTSHYYLDVVIMDINLPGMSGIQFISAYKETRPEIQYLVCTVFEDSENLFNALCAGATGYILKSAPEEEIVKAIKEIHAGGSPMSPQIARMLVASMPKKKANLDLLDQLNVRERQILDLLAEGYRYKEIGDQLFLGVETVRTYIRNIYSKLHVHSRTDAINKLFQR
jgi:DNA-binding NarL/FixJ family response regulator